MEEQVQRRMTNIQAEVEILRGSRDLAVVEWNRQKAEVERLRRCLDEAYQDIALINPDNIRLCAEVEQLKSQVASLHKEQDENAEEARQQEKEIARLITKRDRLCKALEYHSHNSGPYRNKCCWCDCLDPEHKPNCMRQKALMGG